MEDPWPLAEPSASPLAQFLQGSALSALLVFAALAVLSGFYPFFEHVLNACRKNRVQKELSLKAASKGAGRPLKRLLDVMESPRAFLFSGALWSASLRLAGGAAAGIGFYPRLEGLAAGGAGVFFLILAAGVFLLGFLALFLGEIAAKFLAGVFCARFPPEDLAAALLLPASFFALPFRPLALASGRLGASLSRLFKLEGDKAGMTEDELRQALEEGEKSGIVESRERSMVEGVFYLGDRPVRAFMTHRSELQWLDINSSEAEIRAQVLERRAQRCFPVADGSLDEIIGTVYLEDIILDQGEPSPRGLRAIMTEPYFIPETMSAVKAFESFKKCHANFLFVMDEYGGLAGIISAKTLLEKIVGDLSQEYEEKLLEPQEGGVWLADGHLSIDEACRALPLFIDKEGLESYHTMAGFLLFLAGELPAQGDSFEYGGYRFSVKSMNGNRIDKIMIERLEKN